MGVISSFCRKVDESCILLGYYAANSGNSLLTFPTTTHCTTAEKNAVIIMVCVDYSKIILKAMTSKPECPQLVGQLFQQS